MMMIIISDKIYIKVKKYPVIQIDRTH